MTSVVVEREKLLDMMQEWMSIPGVTEKGKLEVLFLHSEVVIRPYDPQREEFNAWLDDAIRRYSDVLERLADS
jgi:hypothetical protein